MTDRYNAFIVILESNIRDDEAQQTIDAIKQIRGVLDVVPHVADSNTAIAEARAKNELWRKVFAVFKGKGE